ncbi:MAG: hypothetical protein AB3N63_04935 [Puniceicoccaceae bacterium]
MEQVVNAINRAASDIMSAVRSGFSNLQSAIEPIRQLPSLIHAQIESTTRGFHDSIRAQILIAIAQEKGRIGAQEQQIKEELIDVDEVRHKLNRDVQALEDDTRKSINEIERSAVDQVMELDGVVIGLQNYAYKDAIGDPVASEIAPFWTLSTALGKGSAASRGILFNNETARLADQADSIIQQCAEIEDKARGFQNEGILPEDIEVPFLIVEYEEAGSAKKELYVMPCGRDKEIRSHFGSLAKSAESIDTFGLRDLEIPWYEYSVGSIYNEKCQGI